MEEKIIIESVNENKKSLLVLAIVVLAFALLVASSWPLLELQYEKELAQYEQYESAWEEYYRAEDALREIEERFSEKYGEIYWVKLTNEERQEYHEYLGKFPDIQYLEHRSDPSNYYDSAISIIIGIVIAILVVDIILWIIFFKTSKMKIVVTNKRLLCTASFGRHVDLPLDCVSSVMQKPFDGLAVATSLGTIKFMFISNRDEIQETISSLLIERQKKASASGNAASQAATAASSADELKKIKELLDSGVITQEEFDAKKKQLLGL